MVARNPDFDIEQFVAKNACGPRQPIDFLPGLEAHGESRFGTLRGTPRRFGGCLCLSQRQPCVVEEGSAGSGQFDTVHASIQQRNADLVFEIADLAAQRRLRRVQLLLGRDCQASGLRDRDEITKMP